MDAHGHPALGRLLQQHADPDAARSELPNDQVTAREVALNVSGELPDAPGDPVFTDQHALHVGVSARAGDGWAPPACGRTFSHCGPPEGGSGGAGSSGGVATTNTGTSNSTE